MMAPFCVAADTYLKEHSIDDGGMQNAVVQVTGAAEFKEVISRCSPPLLTHLLSAESKSSRPAESHQHRGREVSPNCDSGSV